MKYFNIIKKKNLIVLLLVIIEIFSLIFTYKSFNNKSLELSNKLQSENKNFSMYLEDNNGNFVGSNSKVFPSDGQYTIDPIESKCYDINDNTVDVDYSFLSGTITVTSNKTVYCTLYFKLINKLSSELINSSLATLYEGEGYYKSDIDYDSENPFFSKKIYYWNGDNSADQATIKNKWNVVFANSCWQMIRTTNNGGVKLMYNGEAIVGVDSETGNPTYDCSDSRNYGTNIGNRSRTTFSNNYYYGSSYVFDPSTGLFSLENVLENPIYLSSSNANQVIGKYTCRSTSANGTCNTLYYIDAYDSGYYAYAISLSRTSYRDNIAISSGFGGGGELTYGKYMYGDTVTTSSVESYQFNQQFNQSFGMLGNSSINILNTLEMELNYTTTYSGQTDYNDNRYFATSYSYSNSNYSLTNASTASTIKINSLYNDYSDLLGMYTLLKTGANDTHTSLYYVLGVQGNTIYYREITDSETMPTLYNITRSNDQIVVQSKAGAGVNVPVVSNVSNYTVVSFKVNGTTITGNSFIMPSENVTITDVLFRPAIVVETSSHNPSPYSSGETIYENTFTGATSIDVELTYQFQYGWGGYVRLYKTNSSTSFGLYQDNLLTTKNLSIPGDYLKIYYYADYTEAYGFKAIISPVIAGSEQSLGVSGDGSGTLSNRLLTCSKYITVGTSITDNNNGTYTINNPIQIDWLIDYKDYYNYYTCGNSSSSCSYANMKIIYNSDNETNNNRVMYYYYQNINSITIASTITKSGDNFILNNPITMSAFSYYNSGNISNYKGYYICNDLTSTTCPLDNILYINYNDIYVYSNRIYTFSNSYVYDNNVYTLDLNHSSAINIPGPVDSSGDVNFYRVPRYTCLNVSGVCSTIYYVLYSSSYEFQYITLTNGQYVSTDESNQSVFANQNNVLYKVVYSNNTTDSSIKQLIDKWYKFKFDGKDVASVIDGDEIYCNDNRSRNQYGKWRSDVIPYNADNYIYYHNYIDYSDNTREVYEDLNCPVKTFAYSANETTYGNGDLTYPIGLISAPELYILTHSKSASLYYASTGYTLMSPSYRYTTTAGSIMINSNMGRFEQPCDGCSADLGVRPSIALKGSTRFTSGTGSPTDPYVVEVGHDISIDNNNFRVSKNKAAQGDIITISYPVDNVYEIVSFKLNGVKVNGNSFTMPYSDANITNIVSRRIGYEITNSDARVDVPAGALIGATVTLNENPSMQQVSSFKLDGDLVSGNSFVMPSHDVVITNVEFEPIIVETETHSPFPSTTGTTDYYENTFPGATSITVELTYQTYSTSTYYNYVILYQTNQYTTYGSYANNVQTTTTVTIPGSYIRVRWYNRNSSASYRNYYGFRAVITPNYS